MVCLKFDLNRHWCDLSLLFVLVRGHFSNSLPFALAAWHLLALTQFLQVKIHILLNCAKKLAQIEYIGKPWTEHRKEQDL